MLTRQASNCPPRITSHFNLRHNKCWISYTWHSTAQYNTGRTPGLRLDVHELHKLMAVDFNKYLFQVCGSLLNQELICACNVSLSCQRCRYLLKKNSHESDTVDTFPLGRLSRERGASSKSVKYFTTMTCLACFLDAISSRTKSLKKQQKDELSTVHPGKSWIEAWNPNPTFSRGQSLFLQDISFLPVIFISKKLSDGKSR